MTTGDLKNNLLKLRNELKRIKYEKDIDLDSLSKGVPSSFLPIYDYVFLNYSRPLAQLISEHNIELNGKTDLRFMEAVYKVLREIFSYKPPVTKDQFFANSFGERKVIMCTEIICQIRQKHQSMAPKQNKSRATSGSSLTKLGPKLGSSSQTPPEIKPAQVKSASIKDAPVKAITDPSDLNKDQKQVSVQIAAKESDIKLPQPQVINEMRKVAFQGPVSAFANPIPDLSSQQMNDAVRFAAQTQASDAPAVADPNVVISVPAADPSRTEEFTPLTVTARMDLSQEPGFLTDSSLNYNRMSTSSVEVVSMQKATEKETVIEGKPLDDPQLRPIDIVAMTPGRPLVQSMVNGPTDAGSVGVLRQMSEIQQLVHNLNRKVQGIENRVSVVESLLSAQQKELENRSQQDGPPLVLAAEKLENLMARITLIENKTSMLEAGKSMYNMSQVSHLNTGMVHDGSSGMTNSQSSQNTQESTVSLTERCTLPEVYVPSPIPENKNLLGSKTALATHSPPIQGNTLVMSSTPNPSNTNSVLKTPDFFSDNSQAERIKNMVHNTENMLKIQVNSPVKTS